MFETILLEMAQPIELMPYSADIRLGKRMSTLLYELS